MAVDRRGCLLSLGLLGVFLAGAVTGVLVAAGYVHHRLRSFHSDVPHAVQGLAVSWLDGELDLGPDQEATIETIVLEAHRELSHFKSEHNDEIRAIVLPALDRIEAVLTPRQAERWRSTRERILEHVERVDPTLRTRTPH